MAPLVYTIINAALFVGYGVLTAYWIRRQNTEHKTAQETLHRRLLHIEESEARSRLDIQEIRTRMDKLETAVTEVLEGLTGVMQTYAKASEEFRSSPAGRPTAFERILQTDPTDGVE